MNNDSLFKYLKSRVGNLKAENIKLRKLAVILVEEIEAITEKTRIYSQINKKWLSKRLEPEVMSK